MSTRQFKMIPRRMINCKLSDVILFFRLLFKGILLRGDYVKQLEYSFANFNDSKYALMVSSGRMALYLILKALNLPPESEIILPAFTFNAVPQIVEDCGFKPVFVDINKEDYNINAGLIEDKITEHSKAVIATHIFGFPCDMKKIQEIAARRKLLIIEDCAQAIGAMYDGKKVGAYGDCSFFSFESTKPFSTYGGGAIITDNRELLNKMKELTENYPYPSKREILDRILLSLFEIFCTRRYIFSFLIFPFLVIASISGGNLVRIFRKLKTGAKNYMIKFTNFQAAIGLGRLQDLENCNKKRILLARRLANQISSTFKMQKFMSGNPVYYNFVIEAAEVDKLSNYLLLRGIDVDRFFNHDCSKFIDNVNEFTIAANAVKCLISLPIYHQLSRNDVDYMAKTVKSFDEKI